MVSVFIIYMIGRDGVLREYLLNPCFDDMATVICCTRVSNLLKLSDKKKT